MPRKELSGFDGAALNDLNLMLRELYGWAGSLGRAVSGQGGAVAGAVPSSRRVNGRALSADVTLSLASADFAGQGTASTVLHGSASGSPAFSPVATADIAGGAVTYAKFQNVSAQNRLLGRASAGAGAVEEIACTAAGRALLAGEDATAQRASLGLGGASILGVGTAAGTVAAGNDARFVTNGNAHDHSGGDGAAVSYTALTNLPALTGLATLPFADWTAWTPAAVAGVSGGTRVSRYIKFDTLVYFEFHYTLGAVSGDVYFTLPFTPSRSQRFAGYFYDVDVGTRCDAFTFSSSNVCYIRAQYSADTYVRTVSCSAAIPFAWEASDVISVHGWFESTT